MPAATRPPFARQGPRRAVVIGAGSFGTATAVLLTRGGLRTTLQTRTPEQAERLQAARENVEYLPGVELPVDLRIDSVTAGLERFDLIFLAVPSRGLHDVIADLERRGPWRANGGRVAAGIPGTYPRRCAGFRTSPCPAALSGDSGAA